MSTLNNSIIFKIYADILFKCVKKLGRVALLVSGEEGLITCQEAVLEHLQMMISYDAFCNRPAITVI